MKRSFMTWPWLALSVAPGWACRAEGVQGPQPPVAAAAAVNGVADCTDCPAMIVIPAGTFVMGSPDDEAGRYPPEGPRRNLTIARFAMSQHEITRAQYAAFVADTDRRDAPGCKTMGDGSGTTAVSDATASWRSPGFAQAADHPVVCVTWRDARDYAVWLARMTGRDYRLPSEAEWEYAARAGTTTAYYWGDHADRGCGHANSGDASLARGLPRWPEAIASAVRDGEPGAAIVGCDDGASFTAAVGRYEPNAFGLRDMLGNAWEWVADCARAELPDDARPHVDATCALHRARGGCWNDYPRDFRSARRSAAAPDDRWSSTGFRIARSP